MNLKKRGLGKGLSELGLNELLGDDSTAVAEREPDGLKQLAVELLQPGQYQPRRHIAQDSLEELASSIRTQGIIQPILVRRLATGRYEIIAGERRWRAAQLAGLTEVPVIIRDVSDTDTIAIALIENIQRHDLNAVEEALALRRLIEEFQMTHQEVAEAVGKSRTAVTNTLRLLHLNNDVRHLVEQGQLEMGHARALLALESNSQTPVANTIVAKGLSVRETEALIRKLQTAGAEREETVATRTLDPDVARLEKDLSEKLGAPVEIKSGAKGAGKLVINYYSLDELEGILSHIS